MYVYLQKGYKMNEFQLKYGCNPNQKPSRIFMADGSELPVEILNGRPDILISLMHLMVISL